MLTMDKVKPNDFAFFDTLEPANTKSAVKTAFRYIIQLSNLSRTHIDTWDIERVFQKDGKWITDKGEINKAFFEKKESEPIEKLPVSKEVIDLIRPKVRDLFSGQLRTLKNTNAELEGQIERYYQSIHASTVTLRDVREKMLMAELAGKAKENQGVEAVLKILSDLPFELWNVTESNLSFLLKHDTIVPYRDIPNKINRQKNLGRLIFSINTSSLKMTVNRRDQINRWAKVDHHHFHFKNYSSSFCEGGFAPDFGAARKSLDIFKMCESFLRWKDTYAAGDAYVGIECFNHHPAFTEYLEGDARFGKSEKEIAKWCSESNIYCCAPMVLGRQFDKTMGTAISLVYRDDYAFLDTPTGGPMKGVTYELPKPLDAAINSNKDLPTSKPPPGFTVENYLKETSSRYVNLDRVDIYNRNGPPLLAGFPDGFAVEHIGPRTGETFYVNLSEAYQDQLAYQIASEFEALRGVMPDEVREYGEETNEETDEEPDEELEF